MPKDHPQPDPQRTLDHSVQPDYSTRDISQPDDSTRDTTSPHLPADPTWPSVPGYRITSEIAKGGMGKVFAAIDLSLDREVAIKTLLPGANADRFITESKITAKLPHPGIPPVHELGELEDGTPFLAMKLIRGQTLSGLLKSRTSPQDDLPRFVQIFEQIAQAVGFAHSRGVIHRDLKPQNVMVGEFGEVQVMDWGLAKDLASGERESAEFSAATEGQELTQAGAIMGTPAYMAPEQARGEVVDQRADVFALGATLATILTGKPAWTGARAGDTLTKAAKGKPTEVFQRLDAASVDVELVGIAKRCLAPRVADRPKNAQAVAEEVAEYRQRVELRLREAEAAEVEARTRTKEERKRRWLITAAGFAIALILLVGLSVSLWQLDRAVVAENRAVKGESAAKDSANEAKESARQAHEQRAARETTLYQLQISLAEQRWQTGRIPEALALLDDTDRSRRHWEWGYLHRLCKDAALEFPLKHRFVEAVTLSADGRFLVAVGSMRDQFPKTRGGVWVWDVTTKQLVFQAEVGMGLSHVAISPDLKKIAAVESQGVGGTLHVWELKNEKAKRSVPIEIPGEVRFSGPDTLYLAGGVHDGMDYKVAVVEVGFTSGKVESLIKRTFPNSTILAFDSDAKHIAMVPRSAEDKVRGMTVYKLKATEKPIEFPELPVQGLPLQAALLEGGNKVLLQTLGGSIHLFDVATKRALRTIRTTADSALVATHPKEPQVAIYNASTREMSIHDVELGQVRFAIRGLPAGGPGKGTWSADGSGIATGGATGTVSLWRATDPRFRIWKYPHESVNLEAEALPDGKTVLVNHTSKNEIELRAMDTGEVLRRFASAGKPIVHPGGRWIGMTVSDDGKTYLRVVSGDGSKKIAEILQTTFFGGAMVAHPDGRIFIAHKNQILTWNPEATASEQPIAFSRFDGPSLTLNLAISPNGRWLVVSDSREKVTVVDLVNGDTAWKADSCRVEGRSVFTPDSQSLVTLIGDDASAAVVLLETATGKVVRRTVVPPSYLQCATYSPDGRRILVSMRQDTLLMDADTGVILFTWASFKGQQFSANSRTIIGAHRNEVRQLLADVWAER